MPENVKQPVASSSESSESVKPIKGGSAANSGFFGPSPDSPRTSSSNQSVDSENNPDEDNGIRIKIESTKDVLMYQQNQALESIAKSLEMLVGIVMGVLEVQSEKTKKAEKEMEEVRSRVPDYFT